MTKTYQTEMELTRVLQSEGTPATWTEADARAVWDACPVKALFDGFEDYMCALIIRARSPF